ncbi:hypothetical protein [Streptomyces sp. NPDC058964]|uniref:hypothetical protein n=1 Tax=Streptomyces sp. NPDC058964 TaxID=3346681 RepID=UPI003683AAC8
MRFERVLVQGPLRSTDRLCRELTGFVERCLTDLGHPGAEHVRAVLAPAQPLLRALTARRAFPDPAVTLHVAEAEIAVWVSYDPDADDRIDVPLMKLDPGDEGPSAAVLVVNTMEEAEPRLRTAAESAGHDTLRVEVRQATPYAESSTEDAPPAPWEAQRPSALETDPPAPPLLPPADPPAPLLLPPADAPARPVPPVGDNSPVPTPRDGQPVRQQDDGPVPGDRAEPPTAVDPPDGPGPADVLP